MRKGGTASREAIYKVFCSHRRTRLRTLCHAQQHKHPREDLFLAPLKEEKTKVVLSRVFSITGRTTRGKIKPVFAVGKSISIIGVHWREERDTNWRDIIAILCENPNSNIFQSSHHRHERPVRRTGRPAKRAGTHRGTIVARKDDVLPMVREETGFLDDAFLLVFFFLFPNVFLSLSLTALG